MTLWLRAAVGGLAWLAALAGSPSGWAASAPSWEPLAPGLERRLAERDGVRLEALRVDPARLRWRVVVATELRRRAATAREFANVTGALVAINGGFFDPQLRPVGLRKSAGKRTAGALSPALGALVDLRPGTRVLMGSELAGLKPIELVQSGPRLVVDGAPNQLRPQIARRSVAGVDGAGRLVLLVTSRGVIDARVLAAWLAESEERGGFELREALNLDGGGSTQLYVCANGVEIDVPGWTEVADAVVVLPARSTRPVTRKR